MKLSYRIKGTIALLLIILLIFGTLFYFSDIEQLSSPTKIRSLLLGFGIWGYLVYILLLIIIIPLPTPSTPVILAGGYVYGIFVGTLLSLVGAMAAGTVAFYAARYFGRPLIQKLVDKHHIKYFNHLFQRRGNAAALTSYAIPLFPSDILNLLLGITKMKYRTFITLVLIGHIPRYLIINSLGDDLFAGFSIKTLIFLIAGAVFILIAIFREKIKRALFKEMNELEHELDTIEKIILRLTKRI